MIVSKWEVWLADLEPTIGSEQGKTRPIIIISENYTNQSLNVINVLPVTTRKMTELFILTKPSYQQATSVWLMNQ